MCLFTNHSLSFLHKADVDALQPKLHYGNSNDVNGIFDDDRYDRPRMMRLLAKSSTLENRMRGREGGASGEGGRDAGGGGIRDELARKSAPFSATIRYPSVRPFVVRVSKGMSRRFDKVLRTASNGHCRRRAVTFR